MHNAICDPQIVVANEAVGGQSTNYMSIYMVAYGTSTVTLQYGPLVIPLGNNGAPGGNDAGNQSQASFKTLKTAPPDSEVIHDKQVLNSDTKYRMSSMVNCKLCYVKDVSYCMFPAKIAHTFCH